MQLYLHCSPRHPAERTFYLREYYQSEGIDSEGSHTRVVNTIKCGHNDVIYISLLNNGPGAVLMSSITVLVTTLFGSFPKCRHLDPSRSVGKCASVFNFQISSGTFLPQKNRLRLGTSGWSVTQQRQRGK